MNVPKLKKSTAGIIEVSGILNFSLVVDLLKSSRPYFSGEKNITFDLGGVEKTDSAGLALLVEWMLMAEKAGQKIAFQHLPKQMLDIARVSGLDEILPIN